MFLFVSALIAVPEQKRANTMLADGFDLPVGRPPGEGYYMARGFLSYHPGEDWNDVRGGNSDLGAPVYSIGNGVVTFAQDARMGWGNVVIVRHVFLEGGKLQMVDSMYAHLNEIKVKNGEQVKRGQLVGTIGTNRGMYTAHLHYEVRKNLFIGINRSKFAKDLTNYHRPGQFIAQRRRLPGSGRVAAVPIGTYATDQPGYQIPQSGWKSGKSDMPAPRSDRFRVNRFDDIGY